MNSNVATTPQKSAKKLIQARLPFKTISSPAAVIGNDKNTNESSRKRKLSLSEVDGRAVKINKTENVKENLLDSTNDSEKNKVIRIDESSEDNVMHNKCELSKMVPCSVNIECMKTDRNSQKVKSHYKNPISDNDVGAIEIKSDGEETEHSFTIKLPIQKNKKKTNKSAEKACKVQKLEGEHVDEVACVESKNQDIVQSVMKESENETHESEQQSYQSEQMDVDEENVNAEKDSIQMVKSKEIIKLESALNDKNKKPINCFASGEAKASSGNKRQSRSKAKISEDVEENNDNGSFTKNAISKTEVNTPKQKQREHKTENLTPKQLQKKIETEVRAKEKQKAKEDRDRKLQEEKEQKQREREEKDRQRKKEREDKEEMRRKEREEKEEQRRKEKEDRDKKKQAEIDAKNEEKRQKEEERKKKEEDVKEERRKKDEEKQAKEKAEEQKKRKEIEAFTKFFVPNQNKKTENVQQPEQGVCDADSDQYNFKPFCIKNNMKLAPTVRRTLSEQRRLELDRVIKNEQLSVKWKVPSYLFQLRSQEKLPEKDGKTWQDYDSDVMIIDDELEGAAIIEEGSTKQTYRAKFFKFEENRRPAYYGTWRKTSKLIKPRQPFATDKSFFDYEIDSDDEWEEEEPGESLHGSDDEKDKESDDDYDIDNEFFVPHGHLSDEEMMKDDENEDCEEDNTPDAQKAKLKIIQKEFADEMKKKTSKIKPRLIGAIWQNRDGNKPEACPNVIWDVLKSHSMIFSGLQIILKNQPEQMGACGDDSNDEIVALDLKSKRPTFDSVVLTDLIRLIHGNINNRTFLIKEFQQYMSKTNENNSDFKAFSIISIRRKIKELATWRACPEEGTYLNKYCWYVPADVRKEYNLEHLELPNKWQYILQQPKRKEKEPLVNEQITMPLIAIEESLPKVKAKDTKPSIEKFTKVLSEEDKKKQFKLMPVTIPASTPPVKKRVNLLMSGPRGQKICTTEKAASISQFLKTSNPTINHVEKEDVIELD